MTGRVEVRWIPVEPLDLDELSADLHPTELGRRAALGGDAARRFTTAAVALRRVVGRELGMEPRDVEVVRDCAVCGAQHGRPRLPGSDVHASLTHSGAMVGVATTRVAPVGIDVEFDAGPSVWPDFEAVAAGHLASIELPVRDHVEFLRYWTRKEAGGEGHRRRPDRRPAKGPRHAWRHRTPPARLRRA